MILNVLFILTGIVLVLWGADRLTDGAVAVAEKMKMPQFVIGLTIVAMGTSMPEFCVSLIPALRGTSDLAVGNIIGSNIFNALLIVGVAALVAPMTIMKSTVRKDIPFSLVASAMLLIMCLDGDINRIDAAVLFAMFLTFMYMTLKGARTQGANAGGTVEAEGKKPMATWLSVVWILVGLACLIGGSNLFVEGATAVATNLGVTEAVIGLTIVAGGTSLPELATSVVSARKGKSGIAIGNALGSNVFNPCHPWCYGHDNPDEVAGYHSNRPLHAGYFDSPCMAFLLYQVQDYAMGRSCADGGVYRLYLFFAVNCHLVQISAAR